MQALTNLNTLLGLITKNAATIGITLAGLMIAIYAMSIMLSNDNSAMANRNRWESLQRVIICAAIIAGTGILIKFATGLGGMI